MKRLFHLFLASCLSQALLTADLAASSSAQTDVSSGARVAVLAKLPDSLLDAVVEKRGVGSISERLTAGNLHSSYGLLGAFFFGCAVLQRLHRWRASRV